MKKFILGLILFLPLLGKAQAHLGATEFEIKNLHSDKTFETGYTDDGKKHISAFMVLGTFVYYFDKETGLSDFCIQIIEDITSLNAQVEYYNKKYVIISDTKWKAYLEGGGILNIELTYNQENKMYVFTYTN